MQILNFKAINEIRLIQNLAMKNYLINQYLSKNIIKYEEEKEMNCLQPKNNSIITKILHRENIETKKHFKYIVSIKQRQEDEINRIIKSIDQLKYFIYNKENGYSNYIYAEDIIPEDSKEYTKSITIANIDRTLHKILLNKNNKEINNNDDDYDSDNSSMSPVENNLFKKNKKEGNTLNNYINLNMNINLNFNFDKKYNFTDDIKYNSDREIKNKDKNGIKMNKNKKGFYSTGSLPYLLIKSINEEQKILEKNNEKEDVYKSINKSVNINSPEEILDKI